MQLYIQLLIQRLWEVEEEIERVGDDPDGEDAAKELRDEKQALQAEIQALQGTLFPVEGQPQQEPAGEQGKEEEEEEWLI